ncbi:hypothetical protein [Simkania sp.]|uniref:hypothetical protein n=1 Tax=Simkania sp. TaxID=34094 RepID=UPI003B5195DB
MASMRVDTPIHENTQTPNAESDRVVNCSHLLLEREEPNLGSSLDEREVEEVSVSPGIMQQFGNWIFSGFQTVRKAVEHYQKSDLTLGWVMRKFAGTGIRDYQTAYTLLTDYSAFRESRKKGAETHELRLSEDQKRAQDLYARRGKLSPAEQIEFQQILSRLNRAGLAKRQALYRNANFVLSHVDVATLKNQSRNDIQEVVTAYVSKVRGGDLSLDDYSMIELVVSKILLIGMDEKVDSEQQVAFLAATYQEHNRLQTQDQCFTGEDFLRVKIEQLQFLFGGLEHFKWSLTFVEDEPKGDSPRTIDVMREMMQSAEFDGVRDQVHFLDYDVDLKEEIAMYKDPEIAGMSGDEFARASVKGGAIQVGLRYLAQVAPDKQFKTPKTAAIIYTDCDTSVNLGNSGILLNQIYNPDLGHEVGIGSRRIQGAHVVGKSAERHLQSFAFNSLVRLLLNVQLTDTQVGAKVFRPDVITDVHEGFTELSMAFDSEIFRLTMKKGHSVGEDGIVWTDSAIESKSADQSGSMLNGLLRIWEKSFPANPPSGAPMGSLEEFKIKGRALTQEGKLFQSLLKLASDPKWRFVIEHLDDIYLGLAPRDFKNFVHAIENFLKKVATNDLKQDELEAVVKSFLILKENLEESDALAFFFHEFPEVMDVMELLNKDPHYARVIVPLLFGDNPATKLISKHGFDSFGRFLDRCDDIPLGVAFEQWLEHGKKQVEASASKKRVLMDPNIERLDRGIARVAQIHEELQTKGEKRKVSMVIQYNMDGTSRDYIERVLVPKMRQVKESLGEYDTIEWEFLVVDARKERTSGIERDFIEILERESGGNVSGRHIVLEEPTGKASAVRYGMSDAASSSDFVGFIDFSDKIDVLEMTHLFAECHENSGVAIGSRRLQESEVENKPIPFLLRSMGLNLMVKGMFPHLFDISDTQTGFKLFRAGAWQQIAALGLKNDSLAFDIELLQQAKRLGHSISECPVDFLDSTQNVADFGEEQISSLFDEVISIRATTKDTPATPQRPGEARLIGGGAENIVYRLTDGTIVKIPHEALDPDFTGFLKHVLFKGRKEMGMGDQQDKLITSQFISKLLTSPRFSKYIPALRSWNDLNIFVMKVITSFENKNYKSMGYTTAARLGKDLVIPFRFIEEDFVLEIYGKPRAFTAEDNAKQSVFADEVFKDRAQRFIDAKDEEGLKLLVDQGVGLFRDLWKRGLFDLDTNFMCDTGFFEDSSGSQRLMVLDPGELVDDLSLINLEVARNQVDKRYDYIELEILLRSLPPEMKERVLEYYKSQMHQFLNDIEEDLSRPSEARVFGSDQRSGDAFAVEFPDAELPSVDLQGDKTEGQKRREALQRSAVGYQHAYSPHGMPKLPDSSVFYAYRHVVSSSHPQARDSGKVGVEMGSIGPLADTLVDATLYRPTEILMLDAGSATRASVLKYGEDGGTKGGIVVGDKPLYAHSAHDLQWLAENYLPEGYVILASSDDLLNITPDQAEKMRQYLEAGVGFYWCDLPNGGKDVMPLTVTDTQAFLRHHASIGELSEDFLMNVPFAKGAVRSVGTKDSIETVFRAAETVHSTVDDDGVSSSDKTGGGTIPGASVLSDTYGQFLQYNAARKIGGMKTPFLMVMSKEFLADFNREVMPLLPSYVWNEITWENILVRGMKTDRTIWMQSGKPQLMDKEQWGQVYDKIQELKAKHNIDTNSPEQNAARVFDAPWQNFDDPYALFRFAVESMPDHTTKHSKGTYVAFKSEIQGQLVFEGSTATENLFYNVHLKPDETLHVLPNHVVVNIKGELYSIRMGEMSKDQLKNEMVYRYEEGRPVPYKKYSAFMKEMNS